MAIRLDKAGAAADRGTWPESHGPSIWLSHTYPHSHSPGGTALSSSRCILVHSF